MAFAGSTQHRISWPKKPFDLLPMFGKDPGGLSKIPGRQTRKESYSSSPKVGKLKAQNVLLIVY